MAQTFAVDHVTDLWLGASRRLPDVNHLYLVLFSPVLTTLTADFNVGLSALATVSIVVQY